MHHFCTPVLAALALCSAVQAQRLATYVPAAALIAEIQPPVPILPGGVPLGVPYPQVPAMPLIAPPAGDSTFDNVLGFHWLTNGALMVAQATPSFPPAGPLPPAFPIPAAVLGPIGGVATGIALNAAAGIMWVCGPGGVTVGCLPIPGMPIVVAPFLPAFAFAPPITGLEWDAVGGNLIACNIAGFCYPFFPVTGLPAGVVVPPPPGLPGPVGDVAIDRTLRLNGAGLRPLYIAAGPVVVDANLPGPPLFIPIGPAPAQGLAFINHPAANPPVGTCICPATGYPTQFTTSPMTAGNPAWSIGVGGLPPGFPVIFVFDFAFLPGFPLVNGPGCGLGLTALPVIFGGVANPAGNAFVTLTLTPPTLPLGAGPFYNQNITLCTGDPVLGLVLTPTQSVYVSSP